MSLKKKTPAPMSVVDKMIYERQRKLAHIGYMVDRPDIKGRPRVVHDRLKILNKIMELHVEIDLLQCIR